ncbi:iron(III) transport system ATP-binding protein [Micromonospora rhizosphaerae]|uniref:Iron(III) transport system ATP-binding protein n=1 Tax=Micromonospora rhizosphaerae TaxID=568872 RepID=A0A1C6SGY9_9ACTN|nr:ABC transporter ATP-binding protein [Micromonospora rhizosphaerae]SCL28764.1 iron(III) transport system ATP-binding protein [Micromonospora rhizosphaerae]
MLCVKNLVKTFDGERRRRSRAAGAEPARVFAVNDISFDVPNGSLFTLLGPSGCGKTTTLRSIAGLERPDSGTIEVGGRVLFAGGSGAKTVNVPANERGLGMVFQSYAIWPHMSVFDNVAFPLQVKKRASRPGKKEIAERVMRVLQTMELADLADRQATKLSGGQQQRLALARALVIEPPLLLLDEPLSNLDAKLRESLRYELKRLQRELGITSVYVTHDQVEALVLSTSIAVMKGGNVMQLGRPREIYENPNCRFVAEFIGTSNFIAGTVAARENDRYAVDTADGRLLLDSAASIPVGTEVVVSIRPEAVEVGATRAGEVPNEWTGKVLTRAFLGEAVDHVVAVGKHEIRARGNPAVSIEPGTEVYLRMDPGKLTLVPVG